MLTCLSSTAVSWTCAPLHPRRGFSVGQLDRWAERKASVKVPVSRQTGVEAQRDGMGVCSIDIVTWHRPDLYLNANVNALQNKKRKM